MILPPRVAPYQVVMVPIPRGDWRETVLPHAERIKQLDVQVATLTQPYSLILGFINV